MSQNADANKKEMPPDKCPKCNRELTGAIEISSGMVGGISIVVMEETPDRNWIVCDFCNQTICKKCCVMSDSGYCNACYAELKIIPNLPKIK